MFYKLKPSFKDYLWGGISLKTKYNKISDYNRIAESWELSSHKDGKSYLLDCPYQFFNDIPILIKLIDAKKPLSIQVHPNDEYAKINENDFGKTEMWYILDTSGESFIYYGFKKNITSHQFLEALSNNVVIPLLNKVYVNKGDCFLIESGIIHAINQGIILLEVQESSNSTYRIYDYNRRDSNGKLRELHIKKAVDVLSFKQLKPQTSKKEIIESSSDYIIRKLFSCDYFQTFEITVTNRYLYQTKEKKYNCINVIEGNGVVKEDAKNLEFQTGDSFYIECNSNVEIFGNCKLIVTMI